MFFSLNTASGCCFGFVHHFTIHSFRLVESRLYNVHVGVPIRKSDTKEGIITKLEHKTNTRKTEIRTNVRVNRTVWKKAEHYSQKSRRLTKRYLWISICTFYNIWGGGGGYVSVRLCLTRPDLNHSSPLKWICINRGPPNGYVYRALLTCFN